MNRALRAFLGGIIPVIILWIAVFLFFIDQDPYGYGMAILPLIGLSVFILLVGFTITYLIKK